MADWSSLPPELVRRIADRLLDTNDLDLYMVFRAVCPSWRSATDDPKNSSELRFRPCRWIVIDELFDFGSDSRLLVNTVSGRVVRVDLPLLRRYCFVATTHGGFFVLADKKPPHPFTSHMIRFKAPVPCYRGPAAAALSGLFASSLPSVDSVVSDLRSSLALVLLWDSCDRYMAVPDWDDFSRNLDEEDVSSLVMMPFAISGGIYAAADGCQGRVAPLPVALADKIFPVLKLFDIDTCKLYSHKLFNKGFADLSWTGNANCIFLAESAGEILAIDPLTPTIIMQSFLHPIRPTLTPTIIMQSDLKTKKEERVCEAIDPLTPTIIMQSFLHPIRPTFAKPPFTILQFLSSYTVNARESQLEMETFVQGLLPGAVPDNGSYFDEYD